MTLIFGLTGFGLGWGFSTGVGLGFTGWVWAAWGLGRGFRFWRCWLGRGRGRRSGGATGAGSHDLVDNFGRDQVDDLHFFLALGKHWRKKQQGQCRMKYH